MALESFQRKTRTLVTCFVASSRLSWCATVRGGRRSERVDRHPRLLHRIDVRNQRRVRHPRHLRGERRRQRQDVAHHQIRLEPLHQPGQRPRGRRGRLPIGRVRPGRRINRVLLRPGERQPLALDRLSPPLPGLDQHLVTAPPQLSRERDRRKRMPRIAEGGDEQPQASV